MPVRKSVLDLDSQQRLKAIADQTRTSILQLLHDAPASAKEVSSLLDMSHGKVGHHMNVLREAGLIHVVEERKVRALTEKIYAPTFDRLTFSVAGTDRLRFTLEQVAREAMPGSEQPFTPPAMFVTARMSEAKAAEFHEWLLYLIDEFVGSGEEAAETVFGLAGSVFLTGTPKR